MPARRARIKRMPAGASADFGEPPKVPVAREVPE
jgi:hypothetical protein